MGMQLRNIDAPVLRKFIFIHEVNSSFCSSICHGSFYPISYLDDLNGADKVVK